MSLTIAGITFDNVRYDERGDVLYLNVGQPQTAERGVETPEGHAVHFDADGAVIGLTLLNVKWTLERDGEIVLRWPQAHVAAQQLRPALTAA
ncbi:MAG: hypothetical protein QOG09_841 [Solirubrobacterales bacterium]|nr:hypothetical protein [Solirubrobacterales bacterium]